MGGLSLNPPVSLRTPSVQMQPLRVLSGVTDLLNPICALRRLQPDGLWPQLPDRL